MENPLRIGENFLFEIVSPFIPGNLREEFFNMESFSEVVNLVKSFVKERVSDVAYNCWISFIEPVKFENNQAILYTKTQFQRDIIFNQYGDKISAGFEAVLGFPVEVQIITQENLADYQVEAEPAAVPPPLSVVPPAAGPVSPFQASGELRIYLRYLYRWAFQQFCLCGLPRHYNPAARFLQSPVHLRSLRAGENPSADGNCQ